jgi:hypothetical protein
LAFTHAQPKIHDISVNGLGLLMNRPLDPGECFFADLTNPSAQFLQMRSLRVVHATRLPSGQWLIGSSFLMPLREHELQALL